jgi:hypothetical protein
MKGGNMPAKKTSAAKKAGPARKASVARKPRATRRTARGDNYVCRVCGLSVVVDEVCGCGEVHEIICCEQPMRKRATKDKATKQIPTPEISFST